MQDCPGSSTAVRLANSAACPPGVTMMFSRAEVEARVADAAAAGRKSVLFLIQSGGDLRFVPLTIGG